MPNISLTKPQEEYLERQIKLGRFANLSEAVRAGIWALLEKDAHEERVRALRNDYEDVAVRAEAGIGLPRSAK